MTAGKSCNNYLSYSCDGFRCELPRGHDGDHISSEESSAQRMDGSKGQLEFRPVSYEIRWRETDR